MGEETISKAGDVIIEELLIHTHTQKEPYNLVEEGIFAEINIYEGVFEKFMTGEIIIKDAVNFIAEAPLMGNELITIKLRTPTFPDSPRNIIDKTFQIYSIRNRRLNSDREQTYALKFISIEGMSDNYQIITRRFKGNTEEVVKEIYETYMEEARRPMEGSHSPGLICGDTPHSSNISFIANHWTPMQCLDYVSKYANGNKYVGADFVFFETNKVFIFSSLQNLIGVGADHMFEEYQYYQGGLEPKPYRTDSSNIYGGVGVSGMPDMVKISEMRVPRTIDIADGYSTGYYSQSVRAYDLYTKERYNAELDVRKDWSKFLHTEPGCPVPEGVDRNPNTTMTVKILSSVNNLTQSASLPGSKHGNADSENIVAASLMRDNYFNSLRDYTFEIDVPGRTDVACGDMIYLNYPSPRTKTEDVDFDKLFDRQLSGKYLITAIRHKIDTVAHVMKMEVVKNGLPESMGTSETRE